MLAFFEKLLKDNGLLVSFLWRIIGFFLADEMQNGAKTGKMKHAIKNSHSGADLLS